MAAELEISEIPPEDRTSQPLLAAAEHIAAWKEPSTRGKRVFDDKAFVASLREQFAKRGSLTPRQQEALKKLVVRYREQVPGFDGLARDFGLKIPARRASRTGAGAVEE
jgi:hypothetical protein